MVVPDPNADELSSRLLARLDALLAGAQPTPRERSWLDQLARELHAPGKPTAAAQQTHVTPTTARSTVHLIAWGRAQAHRHARSTTRRRNAATHAPVLGRKLASAQKPDEP